MGIGREKGDSAVMEEAAFCYFAPTKGTKMRSKPKRMTS